MKGGERWIGEGYEGEKRVKGRRKVGGEIGKKKRVGVGKRGVRTRKVLRGMVGKKVSGGGERVKRGGIGKE